MANWLTASPQSLIGIVQRALAFFMARYITLHIDPSSGKLDLFRVTFRREKFSDSVALVVQIALRPPPDSRRTPRGRPSSAPGRP